MTTFEHESNFVVPEGDFYYHGTTRKNANSILSGQKSKTILELMADECDLYGVDFEDLVNNQDLWPFFSKYIINSDRDDVLYVTDKFPKAQSYATRAPEWRWHLTKWIDHPDEFNLFSVPSRFPEWYFNRHKDDAPVVLVIRDPNKIPTSKDPFWEKFDTGGEFKLPFPLSPEIEIVHVVEVSREEI